MTDTHYDTSTATRIEPINDRAEWLEWRRGGIGASDIAAIMGISPWQSRFSLWADKTGAVAIDEHESELFEAGHFLELAIGPWWAKRTGGTILETQGLYTRGVGRCTIDGKGQLQDDLINIEIKTGERGDNYDNGIPAHYQAQAQWQMWITGLNVTHFALLAGRILKLYTLERDDEDIAIMIEAAEQFWADHVLTGEPPEIDGSEATRNAMFELYPQAMRDKTVLDRAEVTPLVATYWTAHADMKAAEARKEQAASQLKALIGDAEIAVDEDDTKLFSWTNVPGAHVAAYDKKPSRRISVPKTQGTK